MNRKVLKRRIKFVVDPITDYVFRESKRRVQQYARFYQNCRVKKKTILYESRDGNSMTDSPYAMFKYMVGNPDFKDYTHIWSIQDFAAVSSVVSKYRNYYNVKFVKRNSTEYLKYLATCEYLINNSTFQNFVIPKKDQIYINTWHGTPLKLMGFDIPGNPVQSQNVVRNFLSTDYLVSPNSHTTNMFTKSYKLNGIYSGTIIEEGYPRIDLTLNTDPNEMKQRLRSYGLTTDNQKQHILYAPTWKGTNVSKVNNDIHHIIADMNDLERKVGDKYNVLVKVHPYLYKEASKHADLQNRLVPDFIDTNEILSVVDLLITDYSSIFFDFLVTNKPILFYTWDLDVYNDERGQYLKNNELPGPLLFNAIELVEAIRDIDNVRAAYQEKYDSMKKRFTNHDDGHVTERIVNLIFKNSQEKLNTITNLNSSKEKILIYPGGMRNNGITSSFINLTNNIDYDTYDVSCFLPASSDDEFLRNIEKINKNVRLIFKGGTPVYNIVEHYRDKFIHNRGRNGLLAKKLYPEHIFVREHQRLFGKSTFDYCIDFSGYSLYWAKYIMVADAKKKLCFMHSDMLSDSEKVVNGRRPHRINLRGLFSVYNQFDKLVSVSKGTMEVNKANLSRYAAEDKFDYVLNSINPERILQIEVEEKMEEQPPCVEHFRARAVITGDSAWNLPPFYEGARLFTLGTELKDAEILITRKADSYYKFSHNNQVIGWISADSVEMLPDSILVEKDIQKIAKVTNPKGNQIWSKPYKVPGTEKISGSADYKNVIVDIDKEVETSRGMYSRISINGTVLGWISNSALQVLEADIFKRKLLKTRNYRWKKNVIKNIANRTLSEVRVIRPIYAKIAHPKHHLIYTHAHTHWNAKEMAPAKWLEGEIVTIKAAIKTRYGDSFLFYHEGKKIGWLDSSAFEMLKGSTLIKEVEVSKTAELNVGKKYSIWTKPYGLEGAEKVENVELEGSTVLIDREATTLKGTYSHVMSFGWVNNKALRVLGMDVDGRNILEPSSENINFVTMGRLSPEKGQDNLIKAFARFHKNRPNSKLYLLGEGALKKQLQSLIHENNLNHSVFLLGQVENPFSFLKKCDCFVLSSHYEGQPMVLLEAMTLGMNIIATDIVANRTVLENGKYGLLVENSIEGLEKGLEYMATQGDMYMPAQFDYKYYNEMAMESFYRPLK
ncbi:CDP-glycerol glycerophosphotransferase family protein [Bacillus sp. FJAT-49732]|uniref:CDP-glycerol glycerophosphotransferase family protein n=1 Tax=Lederbergia citrisecunda TaxID=2833583 RepID=A0A942TR66_9BACI|nr:CDP-glycerol glycerophosphotransferase family protein [Lederbergia citrisecunda]MBS4200617.1 CDP-glycerol glycerophosphotransferase family protein [Lederbergia citrisecunda]